MAERLGLFGGSFDPIHLGHVETVEAARRELGIDRVLFLPTAQPPHKATQGASPLERYCMVELALLEYPHLLVSAHELTAGVPAYTVDTVEYFYRQFPQTRLYLLIGADSYLEIDQWRRWRDLLRLVTLVVLERPGYDLDSGPASRCADADVIPVAAHRSDLSSTGLRARFHSGHAPSEGELSRPVIDYCLKYSLYR